jgi:hypothetical protein
MAQLDRLWTRAKAGDGHAVLLSGEPAVGKSRLAAAFEERLGEEPHHRLRYFCSPYHQNSALYPIIAQLERAAGFERDDIPELKLEKLEGLLAALSPIDEDIALLADLLSLGGSPRYPPLDFTPQRKKEKTFAAWLRQIEGLSRQRPVLIVFENLLWADPTSRELRALGLGAAAQCLLGYPARAMHRHGEAITLARRLRDPPSLSHSIFLSCASSQAPGGIAAAVFATATELRELSERHGFPHFQACAQMFLGWALARFGEVLEGIAQMSEGLEILQRIGASMFMPRANSLMADVHLMAHRYREGRGRVARALHFAETGIRVA